MLILLHITRYNMYSDKCTLWFHYLTMCWDTVRSVVDGDICGDSHFNVAGDLAASDVGTHHCSAVTLGGSILSGFEPYDHRGTWGEREGGLRNWGRERKGERERTREVETDAREGITKGGNEGWPGSKICWMQERGRKTRQKMERAETKRQRALPSLSVMFIRACFVDGITALSVLFNCTRNSRPSTSYSELSMRHTLTHVMSFELNMKSLTPLQEPFPGCA